MTNFDLAPDWSGDVTCGVGVGCGVGTTLPDCAAALNPRAVKMMDEDKQIVLKQFVIYYCLSSSKQLDG